MTSSARNIKTNILLLRPNFESGKIFVQYLYKIAHKRIKQKRFVAKIKSISLFLVAREITNTLKVGDAKFSRL